MPNASPTPIIRRCSPRSLQRSCRRRSPVHGLWLACLLALTGAAHADTWTLGVPGTANIYGAGRAVPPGPDGNGGGTLPPEVALPAGSNRVLRVISAAGSIRYGTSVPWNGSDGVSYASYFAFDWEGIAGCRVRNIRQLNGVFVDASEPADPPPAQLQPDSMSFAMLCPLLRQTFPIGDGLSGTAAGDTQRFVIPDGATRLCLGFIDSYSGTKPGWYGDNSGSLTVQFSVNAGQTAEVSAGSPGRFQVLPAAGNALRGGVRIRYALPSPATVRVEIHDVSGRRIRGVGTEVIESEGVRERAWDGRDEAGARVAPGLYFARVSTLVGTGTAKIAAF